MASSIPALSSFSNCLGSITKVLKNHLPGRVRISLAQGLFSLLSRFEESLFLALHIQTISTCTFESSNTPNTLECVYDLVRNYELRPLLVSCYVLKLAVSSLGVFKFEPFSNPLQTSCVTALRLTQVIFTTRAANHQAPHRKQEKFHQEKSMALKVYRLITIKKMFLKPAGAVFYPSCTWVKLIPAWKRIINTKKDISESPWWNEKLDGTKNDIKTPPRSPIWRKNMIVDLLVRVSSFKLSPIRANVLPTSLTLCLSRCRDRWRWQFSPEFFRASIILLLLLCQLLLSTLSCRNFQNLILGTAANKGIFIWTCSVSEGS